MVAENGFLRDHASSRHGASPPQSPTDYDHPRTAHPERESSRSNRSVSPGHLNESSGRRVVKSSRPQPSPSRNAGNNATPPWRPTPRRPSDVAASSRQLPAFSAPNPTTPGSALPLSSIPPLLYAPSDRLSPHTTLSERETGRRTSQAEMPSPTPTQDSVLESAPDSADWHTAVGDDDEDVFRRSIVQDRSPSPGPKASSSSLVSRPRPKTPDPYAAGPFPSRPIQKRHLEQPRPTSQRTRSPSPAPSSHSRSSSKRPEVSSHEPEPQQIAAPQFEGTLGDRFVEPPRKSSSHDLDFGGQTSITPARPGENGTFGLVSRREPIQAVSVMNRPRPKTPDSAALLALRGDTAWGHLPAVPTTSLTRLKSPVSEDLFAFSFDRDDLTPTTLPDHLGLATKSTGTSILDRPRPKTPEPQRWLDQSSIASRAAPNGRTYESQIPLSSPPQSPRQSGHGKGLSTSSSTSTGSGFFRRSSESGSQYRLNSAATTPQQRAADNMSGRSRFASTSSAPPPLLKLDLDFEPSGTMFDLASLLNVGSGSASGSTPTSEPVPGCSHPARPSPPRQQSSSNILSASVTGDRSPGTPVGRKQPPTVDAELERELKRQAQGSDRTPVKATESDEYDEQTKTPVAPIASHFVPTQASVAESVTSPFGAEPTTKKRRKSFGSLLSFVSSNRDRDRDQVSSIKRDESYDSFARSSIDSATRPSMDSSHTRSYSHEPSLSTSTMDSRASQTTQLTSAPSSTVTNRPSADRELVDKSLPPTPPVSSPLGPRSQSPAPPHSVDSPRKGSIGRQLSRLRSRTSSSSNRSNSASTKSSAFQLISATTTKNSFPRNENGGAMLPPPVPSVQQASTNASSSPFGRRLAERFGVGGGAKTPAQPTSVDAGTAAVSQAAPMRKPRRNSLSTLLGGDNTHDNINRDKGGEVKRQGLGAGMLGMSLAAARRSADLLTSATKPLFPDDDESSGSGKKNVTTSGARRSFDLLSDRPRVARWPSRDQLKRMDLPKLAPVTHGPSQPGETEPAVEAGQVSPRFNASSPIYVSPVSTSPGSVEHHSIPSPVDEPVRPASAKGIIRSESQDSLEASNLSPLTSGTATPRLVRTDSLGTGIDTPVPDTSASYATANGHSQEPPKVDRSSGAAAEQPVKVVVAGSEQPPLTVMSSAWLEIEAALAEYTSALSEDRSDRGHVITNTLLPFLRREEDTPSPQAVDEVAKRQRSLLFCWLSTLTDELRSLQPSHRGACLEAVAAISESRFLSPSVLARDPADEAEYRSAIVDVLSFAVEKLNDKAVYANTLVFSGRVLALAFFRIEGVGLKLLRALPTVKRQFLRRVLEEAGMDENNLPRVNVDLYPSHLLNLCLHDLKSYSSLLLPNAARERTKEDEYLVKDGDTVVEMSGNWLIRWTASDSDLPFAFYRAYHRQLAAHLVPASERPYVANQSLLSPSTVLLAPGALFVAASLLEKSDALVHRNLRSVTSIGPNNSNFNTNDSANLSFGQKPKILELANRRVVQTMLDVVGGPPIAPGDLNEAAPDADIRRHAFSRLLKVWIRACIKRTSMWDTRSVFILLDLIEALLYTLSFPAPTSRGSEEDIIVPKPSEACVEMFDISFIFSAVKIILSTADNTVTLMRTIAFVYAHFEILTLRARDRDELCDTIILDEALFVRLYLHWNAGVRGYFIRLLVWRLSRLGIVDAEQHPDQPRDPRILAIFGTMNLRLEAIRKRHDELEPIDNLTEDSFFKPKRSTICSTRGVKEAPFAVDQLVGAVEEDSDEEMSDVAINDEADEAVQNAVNGAPLKKSSIKDVKSMSRMVSWIKGGVGLKKGGDKSKRAVPVAHIDPFDIDAEQNEMPSSPSQQLDDPLEYSNETSTPVDTPWPVHDITPAPSPRDEAPPAEDDVSRRVLARKSIRRSRIATSPSFFAFDFENGLGPPPGSETTDSSDSASINSNLSADTVLPTSPIKRGFPSDPKIAAISPRVSVRFSKRISILPPAALDLFKETGEAVPEIPARFRQEAAPAYDRRLHPYAVRGLRDYEDALDEWTEWAARLQDEEDGGIKHTRGFVDTVPRLAVSWPASFEE